MNIFKQIFERLLREDNVSSEVFGQNATGEYGNQFPSQNSKAYNPFDNRPIDPLKAILGSKKKGKKVKYKVTKRNLNPL